jgi:AsmA protein
MKIQTIVLKLLKWLGIGIVSVLLLMFLLPMLFPGTIEQQVKKVANKSLDSRLDFSHSKLSFFTHFPSLTVSLDNLSLTGSAPYRNETLLKAKQVAFGINLFKLIFSNEVKIDALYVSEADINVQVNEQGQANYNIYIAPKDQPKDSTEEGTAIRLDKIDFENCHIKYRDRSAKILVDAYGFNYLGKGDLSADVFDLRTDARIDSIDFYYDRVPYLKKKFLSADLITRINTNALSFILQKNELRINELPLEFTGLFTILRDGYKIDIDAASKNTTVRDLLSVLPRQFGSWAEQTKVEGKADLTFKFKGRYNAAKKQQPNLSFGLKINEGSVSYKQAKVPLTDFKMDLAGSLPALDPEKITLDLKALQFKLGEKDYFNAQFSSQGLTEMKLKARIKGSIDLKAFDQAMGFESFDVRGSLLADISADGTFSADKLLFPKTKGGVSLKNGWLKTKYYPNPITNITFVANVKNDLGTFEGLQVAVTPASFVFEGNPLYVHAKVSDYEDVTYDARIKGELNVGKIYQVFATKELDVTGYAKADLSLQGKESYATTGQYEKLNNKGTIVLRNIKTTSELFPKAFFIREGLFRFQNEKMFFDKFRCDYGKSDFALNGYLLNTINYFLQSNGTLSGNFYLKSKLINVDEFMALKEGENTDRKPQVEDAKEDHPKMSGVVVIPKNLNVALTADADKVEYNGLLLQALSGKVGVSGGQFTLGKVGFEIIGCRVAIDASYKDESPISARFDARFKAHNFDVQRAYKEIPMFREMVTAAEKTKGIISLDYNVKGDLDGNMAPIYESLSGCGTINLSDVQVTGLKLFGTVSEKTGQSGINNPEMKGINIQTTIDNNVIDIAPFTFGVSGFRPTIKGATSFSGLLDLRIRLGLPPAGLIGIPIVVTGTHEDPKIKVFSKTGKPIEDAIYNTITNKVVKKETRSANRTGKP